MIDFAHLLIEHLLQDDPSEVNQTYKWLYNVWNLFVGSLNKFHQSPNVMCCSDLVVEATKHPCD